MRVWEPPEAFFLLTSCLIYNIACILFGSILHPTFLFYFTVKPLILGIETQLHDMTMALYRFSLFGSNWNASALCLQRKTNLFGWHCGK